MDEFTKQQYEMYAEGGREYLRERVAKLEARLARLAKLAPSAKELEKELFDGMVDISHRGGHGLISAELKKILVAVSETERTADSA